MINKKYKLLICLLCIGSLVRQEAKAQRLVTSPQNARASYKTIYKKERELHFLVKHLDKQGKLLKLDTLIFTTSPTDLYPEWGQTKSIWQRKGEIIKRTTGITENDTILWIHPPRHGDYRILELSPFPMVKYPLQIGSHWQWDLSVGDHWGSKEWVEWKGSKIFKSHYQLISKEVVSTNLGDLMCYKIQAKGSSDLGNTELVMFFNETYGFVKLAYLNINQTAMHLELIEEIFFPMLNFNKSGTKTLPDTIR